MDEPITVSYYVNVKDMTHDMGQQLLRELAEFLTPYQTKGHDVIIRMNSY